MFKLDITIFLAFISTTLFSQSHTSLKLDNEFQNTLDYIDYVFPYNDSLYITIGTDKKGDYECQKDGYFLQLIEIHSINNGLVKRVPCTYLQFFFDDTALLIGKYLFGISPDNADSPTTIYRINIENQTSESVVFEDSFDKKLLELFGPSELLFRDNRLFVLNTFRGIFEIKDWNNTNPKISKVIPTNISKKDNLISNPKEYKNGIIGLGYSGGIKYFDSNKKQKFLYLEEDTSQTVWSVEVQNDSSFYAINNGNVLKFEDFELVQKVNIPANKNDYIQNMCIVNNKLVLIGNKSTLITNLLKEE